MSDKTAEKKECKCGDKCKRKQKPEQVIATSK